MALWETKPYASGYITTKRGPHGEFQSKESVMRGGVSGVPNQDSPVLLTLKIVTNSPYASSKSQVSCDQNQNSFYLILGVEQTGRDTMGLLKIKLIQPSPNTSTDVPTVVPETVPQQSDGVVTIDYSKLSRSDIVKLATGYGDKNMWLHVATAASMNMSDCIACSSARLTVFTSPAPLFLEADPVGFQCMMALTMQTNPSGCANLSDICPPINNATVPPVFIPRINNYTCFSRNSGVDMRQMHKGWCTHTIDVSGWTNASSMVWGEGKSVLVLWRWNTPYQIAPKLVRNMSIGQTSSAFVPDGTLTLHCGDGQGGKTLKLDMTRLLIWEFPGAFLMNINW